MAGRSAHVRAATDTRSRRSASQGPDPLRAPAPAQPPTLSTSASASASAEHPPTLLGFLGDMLQFSSVGLLAASPNSLSSQSTLRSATLPIPTSLLPARSHSRLESRDPREGTHSPTPMAAPPPPNKSHTSPTKPSTTRTYDSKLVTREMHRLGNLAHLPSLAPSISSAAQSTISLGVAMAPAAAPSINSTLSAESPWTSLHVLVLPLFNGEPLRYPIEELNQLVRRHIQTVVSAAPGKALATLEHDSIELISNGMLTLNSKLTGTDDDRLIPRIVELWMFFWGQVLPYLEGSLLPLQTDPILSALYRTPKSHRPSSPTAAQNAKGSGIHLQSAATTSSKIDIRALALVSFRDRVILPLFPRLYARLTMSKDDVQNTVGPESMQARLQQMLLVLVSQRSHRPASLSLTAPPPQPSTGEAAITRLLRALHAPIATLGAPRHAVRTGAAPSFLSAGLPRDRRGRIAQKADAGTPRRRWKARSELDDAYGVLGGGGYAEESVAGGYGGGYVDRYGGAGDWEDADTDTPRVGVTFADPVRARDKELLESLRSPDPENTTRMSMGGWGLGAGREEQAEIDMGEDEDEMDSEDFDHALAMVENMVGIGSAPTGTGTGTGTGTVKGQGGETGVGSSVTQPAQLQQSQQAAQTQVQKEQRRVQLEGYM